MSNKSKKSVVKLAIRIIVSLVILLVVFIVYKMIYKVSSINDLFSNIETKEAVVSEYIVYGPHLNIKGSLDIESSNVKDVKLCFNTINMKNTNEIKLGINKNENGIEFFTSNLINEGIDLEKLNANTYYLFLKVEYTNNTSKYYSLKNGTDYKNDYVEYYTITKNNKNNKVDIKFAKHKLNNQKINYMYIVVNYAKLPDNVYDIVIDPGHGGKDVGAQYGKYNEADLTIKIAKELKEELEDLGFKVRITRDGTEGDEFNVYSVYDTNGRVNVTGNSKAKYVFSIHLNSIEEVDSQSGVEIYAPAKVNLEFAKSLADNIVKYAKTKYSGLEINYKKDKEEYCRVC